MTKHIGILTAGGDSPGLNAAIRGVGKDEGRYGIMVAARGEAAAAVPLDEVAGKLKLIPPEHPWVLSARHVGTNLGD